MNALFDSQPIVISKELAVTFGLNESIVIQQIHYWIENNKKAKRNYYDGYYWTYNSFEEWQKEFPFWCLRTIKTIFKKLENKGILIVGNYNKKGFDRTKWYRLDYHKLKEVIPSCNICTMDSAEIAPTIPEISQRITNNGNIVTYNGSVTQRSTASPTCMSETPKPKDKELKDFIYDYMNDLYYQKFGKVHQRIKQDQYDKVYSTLKDFMDNNGFDIETLYEIAVNYFNKMKDVDFNINHFATEGILTTRALDIGYTDLYEW